MPKKEKSYTIGFSYKTDVLLSKLEKLASAKKISVHEQGEKTFFLISLEDETQRGN